MFKKNYSYFLGEHEWLKIHPGTLSLFSTIKFQGTQDQIMFFEERACAHPHTPAITTFFTKI